MLEGLAAWILNTYVGQYLENLNTDQLSVGLLQGEVELENLPIKKDALNQFGYPIEIKSGYIGKVKLQIPVYRLRSEPWVISAENLFLVVGPASAFDYDEAKEAQSALQQKLARLYSKEAEWRNALDENQDSAHSYMYTNFWKTYSTSILASVAENLQVNIKGVHIRYEDSASCHNCQFACGIIIHCLAAQSTNKNWEPQFISGDTKDVTWKLIQLDGLSAYWDSNSTMIGSLNTQDFCSNMLKQMDLPASSDNVSDSHQYLLETVNATARFQRNCSLQTLKSSQSPRIFCDIHFERIPLFFSKVQYNQILEWDQGFNCLCVKWSNRKWRPPDSVKNCAKLWWKYAISSHLETTWEERRVRTWSFVIQRVKDINSYTKLYRNFLKNPETFSEEDKNTKESLEVKLNFSELQILQHLVMREVQEEYLAQNSSNKQSTGQGFLQWMFPRWVGWYSQTDSEISKYENGLANEEEIRTKLEEEILEVLDNAGDDTLLKKDTLFAQINFSLTQGTFMLLTTEGNSSDSNHKSRKPLVELEFSDVSMKFETRPRTKSLLLEMHLGGLFLHDRVFSSSLFPHLIVPQNRDVYFTCSRPTGSSMVFQFPSPLMEYSEENNQSRYLFELLYEKNPINMSCAHKLVIRTNPLDLIYNAKLLQMIKDFVTPSLNSDHFVEGHSFPEVAAAQYQMFKQHTKSELQNTWDKMLVSREKSKTQWSVELDVSAPQIIIPGNIFDENTNVVIFDLGKLHVLNSKKPLQHTSSFVDFDEEDDDNFHTPCSTPEALEPKSFVLESEKEFNSSMDSDAFFEFLYESYTLELKNMQVLSSSVKDNWKFAQLRGSSSMHILDCFSVNIQVHRKIVETVDEIKWPTLVLISSLPKLTMHISESKMSALMFCLQSLNVHYDTQQKPLSNVSEPSVQTSLPISDISEVKTESQILSEETHAFENPSFHVLMQFQIDQMAFDLESRGYSVAELQVSKLRTCLSKCPKETCITLCVHSLLVVDALQTYGPDFELLVASHKQMSMDSTSGKLTDTDAESSPLHPVATQSFSELASSPQVWSLFNKELEDDCMEDALIFVEYKIMYTVDTNSKLKLNPFQTASIKFNNLDFIVNQETIIELVGLFERIRVGITQMANVTKQVDQLHSVSKTKESMEIEVPLKSVPLEIEATFHFHQLNILLIRAINEGSAVQKLATATLTDAEIKANIGTSTKICGTLGGVEVLDLVTKDTKYQKIISFVHEIPFSHPDENDTSNFRASSINCGSNREVVSFTFIKSETTREIESFGFPESGDFNVRKTTCQVNLIVRMASLCYAHSPYLLYEMSCCAAEFKSYLRALASSIKLAATEAAKGIVSTRSESFSTAFRKSESEDRTNVKYHSLEMEFDHPVSIEQEDLQLNIDILLKTPVVILPCSPTTPEVFIAHLGHIAFQNNIPGPNYSLTSVENSEDSLFIEVKGMNLFFLDSDIKHHTFIPLSQTLKSNETGVDIAPTNDCAILHNTMIEITVQPLQELLLSSFLTKLPCSVDGRRVSNLVQINTNFVSPLKVAFTKKHYEQMRKLLNSFNYKDIEKTSKEFNLEEDKNVDVHTISHPKDEILSHEPLPKPRRILIKSLLELPCLQIELKDEDNDLICITFNKFTFVYEDKNCYEHSIQATLSELLMEDLRDTPYSHQNSMLMSSERKRKRKSTDSVLSTDSCRFISSSCPDVYSCFPRLSSVTSPSLPDYLCAENMFNLPHVSRNRKCGVVKIMSSSYPNTPPPSPSGFESNENLASQSGNSLIHLKVLVVDESSPHFSTKYNKTNLFVNVDFNYLNIMFDIHSWVILLDVFSKYESLNDDGVGEKSSVEKSVICERGSKETLNFQSQYEINVKSLTVFLVKPEYELASGTVANFFSKTVKQGHYLQVEGRLGSLSVKDLTPFGHLYLERVLTSGSEALHFNLTRHLNTDSDDGKYQPTFSIKGHISTIMYVHTQRFVIEIVEFFQYFHDKQHLIGKTDVDTSLPNETCLDSLKPIIFMDVSATSPIIVLPLNSMSERSLVINLKDLSLINTIQKSAGANACELNTALDMQVQKIDAKDIFNIELRDVDVYSCIRMPLGTQNETSLESSLVFPSYVLQKEDSLLHNMCSFRIEVETNAKVPSQEAPFLKISGILSSIHVALTPQQYHLICGILEQNLGETLEEGIYDPYKEIGQFVVVNAEEGISKVLAIHLKLVNVTLELCDDFEAVANLNKKTPFAKFDFIMSQFSYETFTDNTKDIDFVSSEIRVTDVRYKDAPANNRPNVFTNILIPTKEGLSNDSLLQAEIHYHLTHDVTKITVLLNTMRITGVIDFICNTWKFITTTSSDKGSEQKITEKNSASLETDLDAPKGKRQLEVKVNISKTEFVIVEDVSLLDSSALIVKSTAVIFWKPEDLEKPLSCRLQSFEMFSCILGAEDDTALSIVDPFNISFDLFNKPHSPLARLEEHDATYSLEVSASNLYLRFSYYDLLMFMKILESIRAQSIPLMSSGQNVPTPSKLAIDAQTLSHLGFSIEDCHKALSVCEGNLNDSALWLTQNASPISEEGNANVNQELSKDHAVERKRIKLASIEILVDSVGVCFIDDYRESDIPVVEINLSELDVVQKLSENQESRGLFTLSADYYNCAVSGWEPLMEPWKCKLKWNSHMLLSKLTTKYSFHLSGDDTVNFNVTSSFIKLYKMVKHNWSQDSLEGSFKNRRRLQFVPYVLKNDTGCKIKFASKLGDSNRHISGQDQYLHDKTNNNCKVTWIEMEPGDVFPFTFGDRMKMRHEDSHQGKLRQIFVCISGMLPLAPVSVNSVGTYFRHTRPESIHSGYLIRVIFEVKLEDNAQKVITVKSALSVVNKLQDTLEMKMDSSAIFLGAKELRLLVEPFDTVSIPLPYVHSLMWVRPVSKTVAFCDLPINWKHVKKPGEIKGCIRDCSSMKTGVKDYRFCVCIKHGNFPVEDLQDCFHHGKISANFVASSIHPLPGHRIIFIPSLEILNLLPYDLNYCMNDIGLSGCIMPGKSQHIHDIDITREFCFKVSLDQFKRCNEVIILSTARHYPSRLELYDSQDRMLILQLKVMFLAGSALKLIVYSPYWFINKTGLPLVFKQEGSQAEAAGQCEEHEVARSMSPLLFSFSDSDASAMCSMRIGRCLHPSGTPVWSGRFHLENGVRVRRLHISRSDSRPDLVYTMGIEVVFGSKQYKDTSIVIISPRYQLDNRSKHTLEFCQKFAIEESKSYLLSAMSKCNLPFHWPRIDLDNLLCVRNASVQNCCWSGGIGIDSIKSFYVNMRDIDRISHFLQVEIVMHGATFHIIFSDADCLPPPIRIDNYSEVSVTYYQTNVTEERLKTTIRPNSSVPYAWDELTFPPYITCCAPGGSSATYNMNIFREGNQLYYENFIYIAYTATFLRQGNGDTETKSSPFAEGTFSLPLKELVLDVPFPFNGKVVLNRKEAGKRTQLWRMTSCGMLQHEGSSPPSDIHKPNSSDSKVTKLVLDIASLAPLPNTFVPLVLRKPDPRRQNTQTWRFTSDGRLCCGYSNMYVQVKDGYAGLRRGVEAVLGPCVPRRVMLMENGICVEQAVGRQKLRAGSGILTVQVLPDGPTRVLQIADLMQKATIPQAPISEWASERGTTTCTPTLIKSNNNSGTCAIENESKHTYDIQLFVKLNKGVGFSVVNHMNEELVYIIMQDINVELSKTTSGIQLDGSFRNLQVDNQDREAERPVLLYVTPSSKTDTQRHMPAVHFTFHHVISSLVNAKIFKHLILTVKNLTVHLEERLLIKLYQFFVPNEKDNEVEKACKSLNELHSSPFQHNENDSRYYFSTLKLCLQQLRLSVHTTDHLPHELQHVKTKAGIRLIRFEDAAINLDSFLKVHPFETVQFLVESIVDHYKEELKSQAAKILGSVDFLGNPLGLVNDVTDGISELIHEGNVGGLIKNFAHGFSDSAAKLSESLSDGLGLVAMDEKHQRMRKQIRQEGGATTSRIGNDHLKAGIRGLWIGLSGGFTSLYTQTYEGVAQEGIQGLFSGIGRGLVGTVTKPAVGFLDFASGAASAVRDTSKKNTHTLKSRIRPPRLYVGPNGLLLRYSVQHSLNQELLYNLNDKNYNELLIAKETLRSESEDLQVLISNEQVYFLSNNLTALGNVVLKVALKDLLQCNYVSAQEDNKLEPLHYTQLHIKTSSTLGSMLSNNISNYLSSSNDDLVYKRPQVRCDSKEIAEKVTVQINYALSLYEERHFMLLLENNENEHLF